MSRHRRVAASLLVAVSGLAVFVIHATPAGAQVISYAASVAPTPGSTALRPASAPRARGAGVRFVLDDRGEIRRAWERSSTPGLAYRPGQPFDAPARAGRSRLRGAKRGFLIGAAVGVLAGLAITDDFYNDRAVNVVIGAGTIGVVGAGIGALIGVGGAAPH